ncbi:MAG: ATP-binding cassette domain-containing protein [Mangrovicoccus sp.]
MIDVQIEKRQGNFHLDVAFKVPSQGVLGLVGPSGSGKSTLFRCLSGQIRPDAGRFAFKDQVLFDSEAKIDRAMAQRRIGVVFQDGLLFPHMTVRRNLTYGAPRGTALQLDQVVEVLDLGALLKRRPLSLSGGERQRVAIGRALMAEPDLLLLDEPLSALDAERREEAMTLLEQMRDTVATPMIYISHAAEEIRRLADRVITLRDGKIASTGRGPLPQASDAPLPSYALAWAAE